MIRSKANPIYSKNKTKTVVLVQFLFKYYPIPRTKPKLSVFQFWFCPRTVDMEQNCASVLFHKKMEQNCVIFKICY